MEFWPHGVIILSVIYILQFIIGFILLMTDEVKTRRGFILTFTPFLFIPLFVILLFRLPILTYRELKRKWDNLPVGNGDD